jgi:hypothetical protein
VCVIVLNWNQRDDTLACLASLQRSDRPAMEIVVVDNGSADDSVAAIRTRFPQVTLIEAGDNTGYVGGNNLGLERARRSRAAYALLLNNDAEVAPDTLGLLLDAAAAGACTGIVGPTIYYHDRPNVIWSAGGAIDWRRGATRMVGINETDHGQFGDGPRVVDFVSGCALLIKLSVADTIGPLDARFFAYYEDVEWCVRARRAGFAVLHVPRAHAWHRVSPAAREASATVHYYMTRNRLLFLQATRAPWRAWTYTMLLDYLRTLVSWSIRPRWRGKRAQRRAMVRAVRDYFGGRLGRAPVEER